jgi:hypothetical protein
MQRARDAQRFRRQDAGTYSMSRHFMGDDFRCNVVMHLPDASPERQLFALSLTCGY